MPIRLFLSGLGVFFLATCLTRATATPRVEKTVKTVAAIDPDPNEPDGLKLHLSEGQLEAAKLEAVPVAKSTKLDQAETARVINRLPPIEVAETKSFAFRERSLPAPLTGETLNEVFPPQPAVLPPVDERRGPLEVLRFSPDGAVPLAPQVSVTFSEPMVDVTSHAALEKQEAPVKLTPTPPGGSWRWIGTKTILFEAGERLPMATDYQVEVPKGIKSAIGGVLGDAKKWTFSTPAPRLVSRFPEGGPHRTDSLIFLGFDQKVGSASSARHRQCHNQKQTGTGASSRKRVRD